MPAAMHGLRAEPLSLEESTWGVILPLLQPPPSSHPKYRESGSPCPHSCPVPTKSGCLSPCCCQGGCSELQLQTRGHCLGKVCVELCLCWGKSSRTVNPGPTHCLRLLSSVLLCRSWKTPLKTTRTTAT